MEEVNVLVIEDNKKDAILLESILVSEGYKTWVVSTGKEGMDLIKNIAFAVVITELRMPSMNGQEITNEVIKASPLTAVIVITPYAFISSAVEVMEKGAYGYITKPFISSEVKIVVGHTVERYLLMSSDKEKEQFAELSVRDALTGIYNRRFMKVYLNNRIAMLKRASEKISVLMLDIDFFKNYNDTNGHQAGDELLRNISKLLQNSLRAEDIVFRYGGEEFMIFLDHTDKKGAQLVAERIRNTVSVYMPTTISIGVASYPEDGDTFEALISRADTALYKAKDEGRNKVCVA
ncbi:MAG: diguanylate cyclase [Candidatus Omnitrophica bacterium]|nr:diguanylate cyclase [Candidatus Omnitrophota bacterium]